MYGFKLTAHTQTRDKNMKGIFIQNVIDKYYVYNACSELHQSTITCPEASMEQRRWKMSKSKVCHAHVK